MSRIHLSKADVTEVEEQYILDAVRSGWVAPLGPDVDAFEAEIAKPGVGVVVTWPHFRHGWPRLRRHPHRPFQRPVHERQRLGQDRRRQRRSSSIIRSTNAAVYTGAHPPTPTGLSEQHLCLVKSHMRLGVAWSQRKRRGSWMLSNRRFTSVKLAERVRRHIIDMTNRGNSSHVASALSCTDILAVLYSGVLNVRPQEPQWKDRDRFVLSKGHAGAAVYATLAERDFFPLEWLESHYSDGSKMSGHVSHKGIPGVEVSTGSLGHGLPIATGMAYASRLDGQSWRAVCLMSDGECDEGSNWEAILFAAHHKLGNLTAIIDYNKIQSLASVADTLALEPFADKWRAFGWEVIEADGHNHHDLGEALIQSGQDRPRVVIAHTTKGKGVSFMENSVLWHYRSPQGEEYEAAINELTLTRDGGSR